MFADGVEHQSNPPKAALSLEGLSKGRIQSFIRTSFGTSLFPPSTPFFWWLSHIN